LKRVLALLAIGALAPMIQGAIGTFIPLRYCPDLGLLLVVGLGLCWRSTAGGIALSAALISFRDRYSDNTCCYGSLPLVQRARVAAS
jgi:hypothetical protein